VLPSTTVRDLGVLVASDVAMRSHVSRTVSGCSAVLRQLRSIRRSVSDSVFHSLDVHLYKLFEYLFVYEHTTVSKFVLAVLKCIEIGNFVCTKKQHMAYNYGKLLMSLHRARKCSCALIL